LIVVVTGRIILSALAAGGEFLVNRPNLEGAAELKARMLRHELDA
jgi:hypothetical protein